MNQFDDVVVSNYAVPGGDTRFDSLALDSQMPPIGINMVTFYRRFLIGSSSEDLAGWLSVLILFRRFQ